MRVMCINDSGWMLSVPGGVPQERINGPTYGEFCTVKSVYQEEVHFVNRGTMLITFYALTEYPPDNIDNAYQADYFIPIQDQETEVETLQLELIHH